MKLHPPFRKSLKMRLAFYSMLIAVIPIVASFTFITISTQRSLASENLREKTQKLDNFANYLNHTFSAYEASSLLLVKDETIRRGLTTDYGNDLLKKSSFYIYTKSRLWNFSLPDTEYTIYFSNKTLFDFRYMRRLDTLPEEVSGSVLPDLEVNSFYWLPSLSEPASGERFISLFSRFSLPAEYNSLLRIDIPFQEISTILKESFNDITDSLYYCDGEGDAVLLNGGGEGAPGYTRVQAQLQNGHTLRMDVADLPLADKALEAYATLAFLFLIAAGLICFLIYFMVGRLTGSLEKFIFQLGQGDTLNGDSIEVQEEDEVAVIKQKFIQLLENNRQLYEDNIAGLNKSKRLELDLIQAKLNPHLLYNSLSVIKWRAMDNHDQASFDLIQYMTRYYRAVLSRGSNVILLKDELAMIRDYVYINRVAKNTEYDLQIITDEGIENEPIFKLLLQPFVENAILHGLTGRQSPGKLRIEARYAKERHYLEITVYDNGYGVSTEKLEKLNAFDFSAKIGGYGIRNVVERLHNQFGEDFSIHYDSIEGASTIVCLTIPRMKNPDSFSSH